MENETTDETSDDRKQIGDTRGGNSSKQAAKGMSRAHETAGRDEHGANRQDGTGNDYASLPVPPDETTSAAWP